ncbi:uncharacterized protein LOC134233859 [Saccostrea cucullata]|uniref:uncharacterized protein LOC134233859 n=1 Tax=Saccostrea cuccullata TaxID=36930 RepID=UPI002ED35DF2
MLTNDSSTTSADHKEMGTSDITTFVKNLESFCECTICFCIYDENAHVPRILPCNHTFCSECLLKHSSCKKIVCPLCNQEHVIKNKDILIFPKDNMRREMRDLVLIFTSESLCNDCKIYMMQESNFHLCTFCNIRFCNMCFEKRKTNDVCRNHKFECKINSQYDICLLEGHEKNDLKFFCKNETCDKPICANCVVQDHIGHRYTKISDECETLRTKMYEKCRKIKIKIGEAKTCLMKIQKLRSALSTKEKSRRKKLAATVRRGVKSLQEFEENEKKKMSENLISKFKALMKSQKHLEEFIESELRAEFQEYQEFAASISRNTNKEQESDNKGQNGNTPYTQGSIDKVIFSERKKQNMKIKLIEEVEILKECRELGMQISQKLLRVYNLTIIRKSSYLTQMLTNKKRFAETIRKEIRLLLDYERNVNKKKAERLNSNISRLTKRREILENFIDNALECCSISERTLSVGKNISLYNLLVQKLDSFLKTDTDRMIGDLPLSQKSEMEEDIEYVQCKISHVKEKIIFGFAPQSKSMGENPQNMRRTQCESDEDNSCHKPVAITTCTIQLAIGILVAYTCMCIFVLGRW